MLNRCAHFALRAVVTVAITATSLAAQPATRATTTPARTSNTAAPAPVSRLDPALLTGLRWRNVGPARGGRVTAVAGVPSQPATFYMGPTGGGLWKTTDAGQSWLPITGGQIG
jgi:hypothetical protein